MPAAQATVLNFGKATVHRNLSTAALIETSPRSAASTSSEAPRPECPKLKAKRTYRRHGPDFCL